MKKTFALFGSLLPIGAFALQPGTDLYKEKYDISYNLCIETGIEAELCDLWTLCLVNKLTEADSAYLTNDLKIELPINEWYRLKETYSDYCCEQVRICPAEE